MRIPLLLFSLALCSCAHTEVRENGLIVFRTQMNAAEMEYRSPAGSYLKVRGMNHSTPTRAGGSVIGTALSGVAGIMATGAVTGGVVR